MPYVTPSLSMDLSFSGSSGAFTSGLNTPQDTSLLSPALISYASASGGTGMPDSTAYNLLMRHCQSLEHELTKERQDNVSLKYVSHIYCNLVRSLLM